MYSSFAATGPYVDFPGHVYTLMLGGCLFPPKLVSLLAVEILLLVWPGVYEAISKHSVTALCRRLGLAERG